MTKGKRRVSILDRLADGLPGGLLGYGDSVEENSVNLRLGDLDEHLQDRIRKEYNKALRKARDRMDYLDGKEEIGRKEKELAEEMKRMEYEELQHQTRRAIESFFDEESPEDDDIIPHMRKVN